MTLWYSVCRTKLCRILFAHEALSMSYAKVMLEMSLELLPSKRLPLSPYTTYVHAPYRHMSPGYWEIGGKGSSPLLLHTLVDRAGNANVDSPKLKFPNLYLSHANLRKRLVMTPRHLVSFTTRFISYRRQGAWSCDKGLCL